MDSMFWINAVLNVALVMILIIVALVALCLLAWILAQDMRK